MIIISSDLTGETYKTMGDAYAAEEAFKAKKQQEEQERAAKRKALDEAYEKAMAACNEYLKLAKEEIDGIEFEFEFDDDFDIGDLFNIFGME